MPTKRKSRKRKHQSGNVLTPGLHMALEAGSDILHEFEGLSEREVEKKLAELWRVHGSEILPEFVRRFPTERPLLWWRHNSPEPRPTLEFEYDGHDFERFMRAREKQRSQEVALLIRHGLLTREERRSFQMPGGTGEETIGRKAGGR